MRQIKIVKPLDEDIQKNLSDLANLYLNQIGLNYSPKSELQKFLNLGNYVNDGNTVQFSADQIDLLNYVINNFDRIITDVPTDLENHISNINNNLLGCINARNRWILNDFGKKVLEIFSYDGHFRTLERKGIWLAKKLNIKTCPYCNAQYTLIVKTRSKTSKAKFQFDHYFSKMRYPYLSLSFYNLIPSCANCNLSKSNSAVALTDNFHPYYHNLELKSKFKLEYKLDIAKISLGDVLMKDISVKFVAKEDCFETFVNTHNKTFDIDGIYERHLDVAQELLNNTIIYNTYKNDLLKIKGLFNNDESLFRRYLIGNYGLSEEINERPLAKFYQDIAKQLGLID